MRRDGGTGIYEVGGSTHDEGSLMRWRRKREGDVLRRRATLFIAPERAAVAGARHAMMVVVVAVAGGVEDCTVHVRSSNQVTTCLESVCQSRRPRHPVMHLSPLLQLLLRLPLLLCHHRPHHIRSYRFPFSAGPSPRVSSAGCFSSCLAGRA